MANEYGLFWNSVEGDRTYDADDFAEWLRKFFTTGVFNGDLFVEADAGMRIQVNTGYVNINGKVKFFDEVQKFTLDPASGSYPRYDTVVIELNTGNREIYVKVVKGEYSGQNPVATAPVRTDSVYQLVLAQIRVNAGETEIIQAAITDTRPNTTLCGIVTGTVEEMDFSQFSAQFASYYNQFTTTNAEAFRTWFDAIKNQLDTDAAGHLQNEINTINDAITPITTTEIDEITSAR